MSGDAAAMSAEDAQELQVLREFFFYTLSTQTLKTLTTPAPSCGPAPPPQPPPPPHHNLPDPIQTAYDDLVESSREIEDALTQEVADEQKRAANVERRVDELSEQLKASKASTAALKKSLADCEARLGAAEEKAAQSKVERAEMEIMVDEMEEDARRAGANDGAVQAKLERALEDNVLLTTELEVGVGGGVGGGGGGTSLLADTTDTTLLSPIAVLSTYNTPRTIHLRLALCRPQSNGWRRASRGTGSR